VSEVIILGSGSGFASLDRFTTSIALLSNNKVYLFDCGEPCGALLYRAGVDPLATAAIFISHMHPDHAGGLFQLLSTISLPWRNPAHKYRPWSVTRYDPWYVRNVRYPPAPAAAPEGPAPRGNIKLVVPSEAVAPLTAFLPFLYLAPEALPFDLDILPISVPETYNNGAVRVTAVANEHLSSIKTSDVLPSRYPGLRLQSYSFVVEVEGRKLVYSGDINRVEEVAQSARSADVLIIEVAHVAPDDIMRLIKETAVPRIVLTHIHPGLEEWIAEAVRAANDPRVVIAHDGFRFAL
jgi:ribonuclease BN (tRNA processing enzyme)